MTTQAILSYLRASPFRPFSIRMASGRTFDIRHPEMVRVGLRDNIVFKFVSDSADVYDDWDTVGLSLLETISHLEASGA